MPEYLGKPEKLIYLLLLISLPGYVFSGYFLERDDFSLLILIYSCLFACYLLLLKFAGERQVPLLTVFSLVFRVALIGMIPNFSDDFYRFIWDGKLLAAGYNPYRYLPEVVIQNSIAEGADLGPALIAGLNSPSWYSVYPPMNQFIFSFAVLLFPANQLMNIIVMRCFIIAAEAGSLLLCRKLLKHYGMPVRSILIYALNPLVILELTGNLHFEALVIFFLLLSWWMLVRNRWRSAALAFAGAVSVKLLPLIFLPFLLRKIKHRSRFLLFCLAPVLLLFIPFLDGTMIEHLFSSIGLYFHTFEFNAGIYYLFRETGYWLSGENMNGITGPLLSLLATFIILFISIRFPLKRESDDWKVLLLCLTAYLLLATTVHPWYISPLIILCTFTPYRYPVAWSAVIMLSYAAYSTPAYRENLWLVFLEYVVLYAFMLRDKIFTAHKQEKQNI